MSLGPLVGLLTVNWNSEADTVRCMASLLASDHARTLPLVVDNGSDEPAAAHLAAELDGVEVLRSATNLGFTGGYNLGLRTLFEHGADLVFMVNNDAVVAPDALSALLAAAEADSRAALLGPKVCVQGDGGILLSAGGSLVDGWQPVHRGLGEPDRGQFDVPEDVAYLSGCALLVPRWAMETIGGLDDAYFAYMEDVDWCYRAHRAGLRCLYVPAATVWHPDTRTRGDNRGVVTYFIGRNHLYFARKHALGLGVQSRLLARNLRTLLSWTLRPRWRHKRRQRDALALALWDAFRGRHGPAPKRVMAPV